MIQCEKTFPCVSIVDFSFVVIAAGYHHLTVPTESSAIARLHKVMCLHVLHFRQVWYSYNNKIPLHSWDCELGRVGAKGEAER